MSILMCRPDHFGIDYEINPWMHVDVPVDRAAALEQWERLRAVYGELGVDVDVVAPVAGLPDMVFTANAALVWGRRAVLSRFRHPERRGEEPHWDAALRDRGIAVVRLPEEVAFEGAGDALFVGDTLVCATGFRTDPRAPALLAAGLGIEVVAVELADSRFYHLDTCFCPLDARTVLYAPHAFTPESAATIRRVVAHVIEVPVEVAAGFACNALPVGDTVVSSLAAGSLAGDLRGAGFRTVPVPVGEFLKSGGGVRCLSLPLDLGARAA